MNDPTLRAALRKAAEDPARARLPRSAPTAEVEDLLLEGPDPSGALRRLADLPDPWFERPIPPAAARLLHEGTYPARLLAACPDAYAELATPNPAVPDHTALEAMFDAARGRHPPPAALAAVRHRVYLLAARLELEGAPCETVGALLSDLAGFVVERTLGPGIGDEVVVFGMGKLGGRELNFLSDIDLVFVHDEGVDPERTHAALRRAVAEIEAETGAGPMFHVDLRLRPFGRRGPLSLSVQSTLDYYERHGQPWERQAWLRARAVAGRSDLGQRVLQGLSPFVYRRTVSPEIFAEIEELMAVARRDAHGRAAGRVPDLDVKHDRGGIREIEFFVQGLLLLHAGRAPELRTPSTFEALDRLAATGRISGQEHATLSEAYRFLRRVEHRVQLHAGRPTHRLPIDPDARTALARSLMGSSDDPVAELERALRSQMAAATDVAATLWSSEGEPSEQERAVATVTDPAAPPERRTRALAALDLRAPDEAAELLEAVLARARSPFRAPDLRRRGATRLLAAVLSSSDPDTALFRFEAFVRRRGAVDPLWTFLARPETAPDEAIQVMAEILATSESLARSFAEPPPGPWARILGDSFELLLDALAHPRLPSRPDVEAMADRLEAKVSEPYVRSFRLKQRFVLQTALFDLAFHPDPDAIGAALTDVADVVIERSAIAHPCPAPVRLAIFGLGKLGDRAMDYGSDLDLVFVYDGGTAPPEDTRSAATRWARSLVRHLEDARLGAPLYRTDLRLRPSGRSGLLVTSLEAFARHHAHGRPLWERIPLLHLRPVVEICAHRAGLPEVVARNRRLLVPRIVEDVVPRALWNHPIDPDQAIADLAHLLRRIWSEIAQENRHRIHVKAGRGGLVHLELAVDTMTLVHGISGLRAPSTMSDRLAALEAARVLEPAEARALRASYDFLRRVQTRLRLGRASGLRDPEALDLRSPILSIVARRMGHATVEPFVRRLHQERDTIAGIVERLLRRRLPPSRS
ncbi:MAG: hypothetical protein D6705_18100 [Deltaproteobacteria bacterium]|nr:MAG: hypothetical protein D6705_18100 [Deltaproteobacteria bacterium]